jgi:hypothetical protein
MVGGRVSLTWANAARAVAPTSPRMSPRSQGIWSGARALVNRPPARATLLEVR